MSLDDLSRQALTLVANALDKPPAELKAEVDDAERAVVALRDALIEQLREQPGPRVRAPLEQVNAALSLVVGLEYPMGGIARTMLQQAKTALENSRELLAG